MMPPNQMKAHSIEWMLEEQAPAQTAPAQTISMKRFGVSTSSRNRVFFHRECA